MSPIGKPLSGITVGALFLLAGQGLLPETAHADTNKTLNDAQQRGQKIAFTRKLGNCLACHHIDGGQSPGNIAPPLFAMDVRFPDKAKLRAQIDDPMLRNPETSMPAFGKYKVLNEQQMDDLVEFIWAL
jgi:sulfur-oxidizing protein SoxX